MLIIGHTAALITYNNFYGIFFCLMKHHFKLISSVLITLALKSFRALISWNKIFRIFLIPYSERFWGVACLYYNLVFSNICLRQLLTVSCLFSNFVIQFFTGKISRNV